MSVTDLRFDTIRAHVAAIIDATPPVDRPTVIADYIKSTIIPEAGAYARECLRATTLTQVRAVAAATLRLGEAAHAIEDAGDAITVALESALAGHACDRCGGAIAEGHFERSNDEPPLVLCGVCR